MHCPHVDVLVTAVALCLEIKPDGIDQKAQMQTYLNRADVPCLLVASAYTQHLLSTHTGQVLMFWLRVWKVDFHFGPFLEKWRGP